MLSASTMLDVLSAAQVHGGRPERWADDVRGIVMRRSRGTLALETEIYTAADRKLRFLGEAAAGARAKEITRTGHEGLSAAECRRIYETSTFVRTTRRFFREAPPPELAEGMAREGIGDILGVAQPRRDRKEALAFTVLLDVGLQPDRPLCGRWGTLIRHLGALAEARDWVDRGGLEAVMSEAPRRSKRKSEALDDSVRKALRDLDASRARALVRRGDEEAGEAFDLWTYMLDRGFVVLEQTREGAKKRLVAVRLRDPAWEAMCRLAPAERRVVDRVVRGLSNKEVAYELGIEEATVASRLRRAERRLGLRSRVELIRLAREMGDGR
jgi:DNA-binding CsgD family transcriptional regulator